MHAPPTALNRPAPPRARKRHMATRSRVLPLPASGRTPAPSRFPRPSSARGTPLSRGLCKGRSIPLVGGPDAGSAPWNRGVGGDAGVDSPALDRRETPEISEGLRPVGGGGCSAGALEPELLDAGLEGGGLEAEQRGGALRAADAQPPEWRSLPGRFGSRRLWLQHGGSFSPNTAGSFADFARFAVELLYSGSVAPAPPSPAPA